MINNELLADAICTQGFYIIDNFLETTSCHSLRLFADKLQNKGLFRNAKIGLELQQNNTIRTDEICWLDEQSAEPAVVAYLQATKNIARILNQSLFLGLNEFETHFATYQAGSFYKKHIDQFRTTKTRKISCVYYLNKDWQTEDGGELKIYNKEDELIQTVSPIENRFICFNSELPHEVCTTNKTRYSIAGWMKTRASSELITTKTVEI